MEQNDLYNVNGVVVKIPKDKYEFNRPYLDRVSFIISKLKKYNDYKEIKRNKDNIILMSRIYVNEKILNCKY